METRRLKISERIQEDLSVVEESFGVSQHLIEGMAVYHGIENIIKGFVPKFVGRKVKEENRSELSISLSSDLWNDFEICRKKYKLPSWEFMEILLNVELDRYRKLFEEIEEKEEEEKVIIKPSAIVPERSRYIQERIGIDEEQLREYYWVNGIIEEERNCIGKYFVPFDADIIEEIEKLNLNPVKAATFAAFIIKYKCQNGNYKD